MLIYKSCQSQDQYVNEQEIDAQPIQMEVHREIAPVLQQQGVAKQDIEISRKLKGTVIGEKFTWKNRGKMYIKDGTHPNASNDRTGTYLANNTRLEGNEIDAHP